MSRWRSLTVVYCMISQIELRHGTKDSSRGLTPCGSEAFGESREVTRPGLGNRAESGVLAQGKIANQHAGGAVRAIERIRVRKAAIESFELKGAGGAFGESPVVREKTV
jgi:hypothetical protein